MASVKICMPCGGLGRVNRGYETFTQECFNALKDHPDLHISLYKGGGKPAKQETVLPNLPRDNRFSAWLSGVLGKEFWWIESVSFALSLIPYIWHQKPQIVYVSEVIVSKVLWRWKRRSGADFKLVLCNGAPTAPPYPIWDHVHQVTPVYYRLGQEAGESERRQTMIPLGFQINPKLETISGRAKAALRKRLSLPEDRPLVLSVGALTQGHKRMDYIIREVAALPAPRPYLLLLGQVEKETPAVLRLAREALGEMNCAVRTVPFEEMADYYRAADIFALGSLHEGFGRVYVEALAHGLPCLAHDYDISRFVIADPRMRADFTAPGGLSVLLCDFLSRINDIEATQQRHQSVYERFSWARLTPQYAKMFLQIAG